MLPRELGYYDADGLIPGCGAAHDLYAGLGGRKTVAHFRAWLEAQEGLPWDEALINVGHRYIQRVRGLND